MARSELLHIPLGDIRPGEIALRSVDQDSQEFKEVADSVAREGVLNPISVRRKKDAATGQDYFEIIDGLQRYTSAKIANHETIPAQVLDKDDEEVMIAQIIGNAKRVITKPIDFQHQIMKLMVARPTMTGGELADTLHCTPQWIDQILKLKNLHEELRPLVNDGHIPLTNAFALAKLPPDEQLVYKTDAQTKPASEFTGPVFERAKALKAASRSGKDAGEAEFTPIPRFRKLDEVKAEMDKPSQAREIVQNYMSTVPDSGVTDVKSAAIGFVLGIKWATRTDPKSVEVAKAEFEGKKKAAADERLRKDAERAEKRQAEAEERAKKAKEEVEKARKAVPAGV